MHRRGIGGAAAQTWTPLFPEADLDNLLPGTATGQKYRVRIEYLGPEAIRVHRRTVGAPAGDGAWELLFDEEIDLGPPETDRVQFTLASGVDASFDNVHLQSTSNLQEFLHLAENSPYINLGFTHTHVTPFRDFSYQVGPVDGPDDLLEIDRDIGADEWPRIPDATY